MATRYLAVAYAPGAAPEAVTSMLPKGDDWLLHEDGHGFVLCVERASQIIRSEDGRCTIIGKVFAGVEGGPAATQFTPGELRSLFYTRGASLIRSHWGGYVAFLHDGAARSVEVVRDPSGAMPCYYAETSDGIVLIASDIALLISTGIIDAVVDWDAVAGHLLAPNLRPSRTALSGLTELLGGFRLTLGPTKRVLDQIWSPWTYTEPGRQITDGSEAAARLRAATVGCVGSWASSFHHLLLGVSGGLDSSIVAACLALGGHDFSCVTLATDDPIGDERTYARILTDHLGLPLHEHMESADDVEIMRSAASHLPRPVARLFAQSGDAVQTRLAARLGADAFISGGGGDNVFCSLSSAAPLADRLRVQGIGRGAIATMADIAKMTGSSSWAVLKQGIARAWFRPSSYCWPLGNYFLSGDAIMRGSALCHHPWLDAPADALPGKAAHIAWLLGVQNHLEGFGRERIHPLLAPLMSQPLVELCLTIPSWMWCEGGRNRSLARTAFADELPEALVRRTSKGTPASFVMQLMEIHRAAFRELLLEGLLAHQGLLDREAIDRAFGDDAPLRGTSFVQLMALVDTEIWVRLWERRPATEGEIVSA